MNAKPDSTRRAPCNRCLHETNHVVRWEDHRPGHEVVDEEIGACIDWGDTYTVLECAGCNEVRLLHRHWFSEDTDGEGAPNVYLNYFPPTVTRQKPLWRREFFPFVPAVVNELNPLFDEVYAAHAAGAFSLAAMGIRALVEKIMIEKVGDKETFGQTADAFFAAGFVAPVQRGRFRTVLIEAGHAAMHRSFRPSRQDIETLLDWVEGLVDAIYYEPMRSGTVGKKLPPNNRSSLQPTL